MYIIIAIKGCSATVIPNIIKTYLTSVSKFRVHVDMHKKHKMSTQHGAVKTSLLQLQAGQIRPQMEPSQHTHWRKLS